MQELLKQLEEDKKALADLGDLSELPEDEEEKVETETVEEEPAEEEADDTGEEEAEEEKPAKEEEPAPKEEPLYAAGYARLRREKEAEKRRADELEAKLAALSKQAPVEQAEEVQAESTVQTSPEIEAIIQNERFNAAEREVIRMEREFMESAPDDYQDVVNQYKAQVYQSVMVDNPDFSHEEILSETRKKLLYRASAYAQRGYNPVEKMYLDARKIYKPVAKQAEEQPVEKLKPDPAKLAANRQRNAGMAAAGGRSTGAQITREVAATYSPKEWAKLPKEEKDRLMNEA